MSDVIANEVSNISTMSEIANEVSSMLDLEHRVLSELLRLNALAKDRPQDMNFEAASTSIRGTLRQHSEHIDMLDVETWHPASGRADHEWR